MSHSSRNLEIVAPGLEARERLSEPKNTPEQDFFVDLHDFGEICVEEENVDPGVLFYRQQQIASTITSLLVSGKKIIIDVLSDDNSDYPGLERISGAMEIVEAKWFGGQAVEARICPLKDDGSLTMLSDDEPKIDISDLASAYFSQALRLVIKI